MKVGEGMAGILDTNVVTQVGFVVRDIVRAKEKFAEFFGVEPPEHFDAGKYEVTGTVYYGKPAPDANCYLAFFDAGGVQVELIQPNGEKSAWQDFLDERGEGIHHIAFQVKGMDEKIKACEQMGMPLAQRGKYGDGSGEYAYLNAFDDLKCYIELLTSY